MGQAVGEQISANVGIHVNGCAGSGHQHNPNNPVMVIAHLEKTKDKVSRYGIAYMKEMQDVGIMACAKHFPGHGDVDVDSHLDLPVINKNHDTTIRWIF